MGTMTCKSCDTTRVTPAGLAAEDTDRCTMCTVVAGIPDLVPGSAEEVKLFDTILTLATRADRARRVSGTFGSGSRSAAATFDAVALTSDLFTLFNALSEDQADRYASHRSMRLRDAAATPTAADAP